MYRIFFSNTAFNTLQSSFCCNRCHFVKRYMLNKSTFVYKTLQTPFTLVYHSYTSIIAHLLAPMMPQRLFLFHMVWRKIHLHPLLRLTRNPGFTLQIRFIIHIYILTLVTIYTFEMFSVFIQSRQIGTYIYSISTNIHVLSLQIDITYHFSNIFQVYYSCYRCEKRVAVVVLNVYDLVKGINTYIYGCHTSRQSSFEFFIGIAH